MKTISEQGYIQQVSIDCVIFGYLDKKLHVLIPKLSFTGDFWCLPSGFVYEHEDTDEAARRVLQNRAGVSQAYLDQFLVMGKADRTSQAFLDRLIELNPEKLAAKQRHPNDYDWFVRRTISIGYYALVDMTQVVPQQQVMDESIGWYAIPSIPAMIMDHNQIVDKALERLRADLDQKPVAFHLLPETFTMRDVQDLYETILEKPFAANNFPKKILELNALERLEKKFTGAANKAPYLYRLRK